MNFWRFVSVAAALVLPMTAGAQVKTALPPAVKPAYSTSLQMVVVTTSDWTAVKGSAQLFERQRVNAKWKPVGDPFAVVVGRNGLGWDDDTQLPGKPKFQKREGDGRSPAGLMPLTSVFSISEKPEAVDLPFTRLVEFTECVDDVNSTHYNRIVNRMQVGNFDWKSSEKMLAVGEEYSLGVFVAYNTYPVKRGNGSCIFLHVWKDASTGTSGCTAMARHDLERLAAWLEKDKNPYLVQLPDDIYDKYRTTWNLPKLK